MSPRMRTRFTRCRLARRTAAHAADLRGACAGGGRSGAALVPPANVAARRAPAAVRATRPAAGFRRPRRGHRRASHASAPRTPRALARRQVERRMGARTARRPLFVLQPSSAGASRRGPSGRAQAAAASSPARRRAHCAPLREFLRTSSCAAACLLPLREDAAAVSPPSRWLARRRMCEAARRAMVATTDRSGADAATQRRSARSCAATQRSGAATGSRRASARAPRASREHEIDYALLKIQRRRAACAIRSLGGGGCSPAPRSPSRPSPPSAAGPSRNADGAERRARPRSSPAAAAVRRAASAAHPPAAATSDRQRPSAAGGTTLGGAAGHDAQVRERCVDAPST